MFISDWIECFERRVPPQLQESWDHTGRQFGRFDRPLTGIVLALDLTEKALQTADGCGANLILTHHPVLFDAVHFLDERVALQDWVMQAIESGVAVYSSHTALDIVDGGVNDVLAERAGLQDVLPLRERPADDPLIGYAQSLIGTWGRHDPVSLEVYARELKAAFATESVVYYGDPTAEIRTVGCLGGGGMEAVADCKRLGLDVLLTSDARYHEAQDAVHSGVNVVDLGHFASEFPVLERVAAWSKEWAPDVAVNVVDNGEEGLRHLV